MWPVVARGAYWPTRDNAHKNVFRSSPSSVAPTAQNVFRAAHAKRVTTKPPKPVAPNTFGRWFEQTTKRGGLNQRWRTLV